MTSIRKHGNKELIIRIFLVVFSVLIFFAAFEVLIRFYYGKQRLYQTDEELYWKHVPSQTGYQKIGFPKATINSKGFRGTELEDGKRNVIMLGDSYTFGWGVKDNETFSYILEKKLASIDKEYRVVNMGVSGWGLFQEKIQLERTYEDYRPKIVVLTIISDDLRRKEIQNKNEKVEFLKKMENSGWIFSNSATLQFIQNFILKKTYVKYKIKDKTISELWKTEEIKLKSIHNITRNINATLILIFYPDRNPEFYEPLSEIKGWDKTVVIDDLQIYFEPFEIEDLHTDDGHPTSLAHKIIAERIFIKIKKNSPLISNKINLLKGEDREQVNI